MRLRAVTLTAIAVGALVQPSFGQIIATSIPREDTGGPQAGAAGEKKFALHLMVSPISKWRYNEFFGGVFNDFHAGIGEVTFVDTGVFTGDPNSDFLLAGEAVFKVADDWSIGLGGWYNKVGTVGYDFDAASFEFVRSNGAFVGDDRVTGTLDGDLKVAEGHLSIFYKNFGIQGGIVRTTSRIDNSIILTSETGLNRIGVPLGSVEGENKATDQTLYGVYKFGGGSAERPWGISLGAGVYRKKGNTESSQRLAEDQTVPSAFATASVTVWKGLGIDASYWYVGKTEASRGEGAIITSDEASRLTLGIGYTFSR